MPLKIGDPVAKKWISKETTFYRSIDLFQNKGASLSLGKFILLFFVSWRVVYTSCLNILIWLIEKVNYENLTIRNYKKMRKRPPAPFLGRNLQNRHRKRSRRTNKQKQKNFYFRQTKEQSSLLSRKKAPKQFLSVFTD